MPAVASNANPAPRVLRSTGAHAPAVSGEEAQCSSFLLTRTAPRGSLPGPTLLRYPVPSGDHSASARGRGATCPLWPPTPSQRRASCAAQARLRSLSLEKRRSAQAFCARAPRRPGRDRGLRRNAAQRQRETSLIRRTAMVPRANCVSSNAKMVPCVLRSAGAPALAVTGEEAQCSTLLRARKAPRGSRSGPSPQ